MAAKKTTPINLFDEAIGINGQPPIDIAVGDVELSLRRSHTGMQVAEWSRVEDERIQQAAEVLQDDSLSEEDKSDKIAEVMRTYSVKLLESLCTDKTRAADIEAAADKIAVLPSSARNRVFRYVGTLSGVVDEDGTPFPSTTSSKMRNATKK